MEAYRVSERLYSIELIRTELADPQLKLGCALQEKPEGAKQYRPNLGFPVVVSSNDALRNGVSIKQSRFFLEVFLSPKSIKEIVEKGIVTEELDKVMYAIRVK